MITPQKKAWMKRQLLKLKNAEATLYKRTPEARKQHVQASLDIDSVVAWLRKQKNVFFHRRGSEMYLVDKNLTVLASTKDTD